MLTVTDPQDSLPGFQNTMVFGPAGGCIGRGQDNDWVLPDPDRYLSVHHARVRFRGGAYFIEDISTNGVFVNGARRALGKSASPRLRDGDRLRLGAYELQVSLGELDIDTSSPDSASLSNQSIEALLIDHSSMLSALQLPAEEQQAPDVSLGRPLTDRRRAPRPSAGITSEIDAFCRGAGIAATELPASGHLAALQLAGLMLREALLGAREMAKSRREVLRRSGLNPEVEESGRAVLHRLSVEELLMQFLTGQDPSLPEAIPWLRDVFGTARRSDAAFIRATRSALAEFLRRLEPAALNAGGAADERFRALTDMHTDGMPAMYAEALARHFTALLHGEE